MTCCNRESLIISTDKSFLNTQIIYQFLKESYWAQTRTYQQVLESIRNSLCFGMYEDKNQIGFARVITDNSTFAYLADVFILPSYQKMGLGKWLIETIFNTEELKNISSWMLVTKDAHDLYKKFGFSEFPYPERVMLKKPGYATALMQADERLANFKI